MILECKYNSYKSIDLMINLINCLMGKIHNKVMNFKKMKKLKFNSKDYRLLNLKKNKR